MTSFIRISGFLVSLTLYILANGWYRIRRDEHIQNKIGFAMGLVGKMLNVKDIRDTEALLLKVTTFINETWTKYDKDQSGYLEKSELRRFVIDMFKQLGFEHGVKREDIDYFMEAVDVDKDGRASRVEMRNFFIMMIKAHKHHVEERGPRPNSAGARFQTPRKVKKAQLGRREEDLQKML